MRIWELINNIGFAVLPVMLTIGLLLAKKELKRYCGV